MKVPGFFSNADVLRILAVTFLVVGCCLPVMAERSDEKDRHVVEGCKRCHDVKMYQFELKNSTHAVDKDNKEITWGLVLTSAIDDVMHLIFPQQVVASPDNC